MSGSIPSQIVNLALNKPASQSSLSKFSGPNDAGRAVNGEIGKSFNFHTKMERNPWWKVDLGFVYPIEKIVIHNRQDQGAERAKTLQVEISRDEESWELIHAGCVHFGGGDGALVLPLRFKESARYVRLSLRGDPVLALSQIEVYGDLSARFRHRYQLLTLPVAGTNRTHGRVPYVLEDEAGTPLREAPDDTIIGLRIRPVGRLGNQMLQLINAVVLAKRIGIRFIRTLDGGLFKLEEPLDYDGVTLLPEKAEAPEKGAYLAGNFFFHFDLLPALQKVPQEQRYEIAQKLIRSRFMAPLPLQADVKDDEELTVHIRAGDIFAQAPMGYTQPPLAFYRLIIRYGIENRMFSKVRLVFENRANPCIDGLIDWLKEEDIPYRTQTGTLTEDLAALVNAKNLTFGFGTFGIAVALLSERPATIFCLEGFTHTSYPGLPSVARTIVVRDAGKGYMKVGDWKHTLAQRALMMSYPETELEILAPRIEEDPDAPAAAERLDVPQPV